MLTLGISLGSSTVLVRVRSPASIGHSRSTFLTCSQRSALVLIRRIKPYLTCKATYAPSSMGSETVPEALMTRSCPLLRQAPRLARSSELSVGPCWPPSRVYARLWGVWHQVDLVDGDDVLVVCLGAQLERRVAGDLEVLVHSDLVAPEVETEAGMGEAGRERDKRGGQPHGEGCGREDGGLWF